MIDDNETFVRAVEKAHDELGLTYVAIAESLGMSDSNLWAIRTQGRQQRATAGTKAVLDQFYAQRGSSAVVVVGAFYAGQPQGRKWETVGYHDRKMLDEVQDDLENIVQGDLDDLVQDGIYEPDLRISVEEIEPSGVRGQDIAATYSSSAFQEDGMDAIDS